MSTDGEVASALDGIACAAGALRRMIPRMSTEQCAAVAASCPWGDAAIDTLIELDTWAVIAAAGLRTGITQALSA